MLILLISALIPVSMASEVVPTITNMVKAAEIKYDLPQGLLQAVMMVESNGNHIAINPNDGNKLHKSRGMRIPSYGLLQIQHATAIFIQRTMYEQEKRTLYKRDIIKVKDLMRPSINIEYGAYYLKWLLQEKDNDVSLTLTCFNAGPNSHLCKNERYYGEYVGKVLNAWASIKNEE